MSSNFSWFLRFIIYIPLSISIIIVLGYSYLTSRFDQNLQDCLQEMQVTPSPADRKRMVPFVGCLKKKSNFFLTKAMKEDRLYQYANPKLPCYFVGKWHVSTSLNEYWLTISPDASISMEAVSYMPDQEQKANRVRTGIWSVDHGKVIQFADDSSFWPINESSLHIFDARHFAIHDTFGESTIAYRHSELNPACTDAL